MTGKRGLTQEHAARMLGTHSLEAAAARLKPDFENLPLATTEAALVASYHCGCLPRTDGPRRNRKRPRARRGVRGAAP